MEKYFLFHRTDEERIMIVQSDTQEHAQGFIEAECDYFFGYDKEITIAEVNILKYLSWEGNEILENIEFYYNV